MMNNFKKFILLKINKFKTVIVFAVKGFKEDRCDLRASSLTLFTLLSIVPVMAMAFGIAKGFGFQTILEKRILELFAGQEEKYRMFWNFPPIFLRKQRVD